MRGTRPPEHEITSRWPPNDRRTIPWVSINHPYEHCNEPLNGVYAVGGLLPVNYAHLPSKRTGPTRAQSHGWITISQLNPLTV